jgi:hypothetical protein
MESNFKIFAIVIALIFSSIAFPKQLSAQGPNVSFQVFYDQLSPYGQWVDYSNYGYVWIPDAGSDFVPYSTRGHWVLTEYGFAWVSDYNWGWAPFHYGRWDFDNYYGWFWVPDNEWAPAWVNWRSANGYYGWAPMEPGISISVSFGRGYSSQNDHWIFVRDRDIDRSNINRYYVNRIDHDRIIRDSRMIENTYFDSRRNTKYVSGPSREDVQKVTGRRVNPVVIQENDKPGQDLRNGQLKIYRPEVVKNYSREQRPAPSKVTNLKDVKSPIERNTAKQTVKSNPTNATQLAAQKNTVNPPVKNNNSNSVQPQNSTQVNSRREVQQNTATPPKSNNTTNSVQPQNSTQVNNRQEVQQNKVNPPNSTNNTKAVQQVKAKPAKKTKKVKQPEVVKPANKENTAPPKKTEEKKVEEK